MELFAAPACMLFMAVIYAMTSSYDFSEEFIMGSARTWRPGIRGSAPPQGPAVPFRVAAVRRFSSSYLRTNEYPRIARQRRHNETKIPPISFTHSFTYSFISSLIHRFIHSFTHLLTSHCGTSAGYLGTVRK
eukprot:GHVU01222408.1.p1 GENE.GHVU01222408.1~~GHVU01222408.1.p1  ORF type:complete len:132 (+),score=7.07 GHVU01222408.1:79-474(+)